MTDLNVVLPDFATDKYIRLIPSLEKNRITTTDLLTLDFIEVAKRANLPLLDVKRLCNDVLQALQTSLGVDGGEGSELKKSGRQIWDRWNTISTLDEKLDAALGGGIPTGYITEITGESGAGKTQFLLTLLLSVQLPSPYGLSSAAIYISTESALPTNRLSQLLSTHPLLQSQEKAPTLDKIISIVTPDLESQDHILHYQVPVAIRRHGIKLLIIDSIAANYRAEFEREGVSTNGANMAQRSSELVKLGSYLRDLARRENVAIVVANQVADRFSGSSGKTMGARESRTNRSGSSTPIPPRVSQSSPLARHSHPGPAITDLLPSSSVPEPTQPGVDAGNVISGTTVTSTTHSSYITNDPLSLDHQQRWFTGWGDDPYPPPSLARNLKTPSLGLIWTTQIAARIALIKRPVYGRPVLVEEGDRGEPVLKRWKRWMKVVFAPHINPSGVGVRDSVEFEIVGGGVRGVDKKKHGDVTGNGDEEDDENEEVPIPTTLH
ncbi:P-loop containing nucleoside triphosphate hydrolase protein [Xylogone sp. PMI_703]|nr:P-loop containing nucleoside triphosphate hydrolase protein [Xylogone sp. PMI_703]